MRPQRHIRKGEAFSGLGRGDAIMGSMKRLTSAKAAPSKRRGKRLWWLALVSAMCVGLVVLARWWTNDRYGPLIYTLETAPPRRVAIVFGAAVWADGRPSAVLADRVHTAAALYHAGACKSCS